MNTKKMSALACSNVRELVSEANKVGINQEDVVTVISQHSQVFLIYYK